MLTLMFQIPDKSASATCSRPSTSTKVISIMEPFVPMKLCFGSALSPAHILRYMK